MRFNFKKVASVLASAVMLSSTVGMAAAAAYPSPFVTGGAANVAVVIGANAATIDNIAAVDIASDLSSELAKQTATGGDSAVSTTEESVNLATSSTKLYFNSTLDAARASLTKSELPTLLADGEVTDDAGTTYAYTQSIALGRKKIEYSTSGGDLDDPALIIEAGAPTSVGDDIANKIYKYSLAFSKEINVSSSDVQGNEIEILGQAYVIGASSTRTLLYLYGAGVAQTLSEGESATVTVSGTDYTVEITSIDSSSRVAVSVDGGTSRRISEGTTVKIGDIEVYAKNVYYLAKEAQVSYADLNIGSKKLKIVNGQTVKEGTDEIAIQGTLANVTAGSNTGIISGFGISVVKQKVLEDFIKIGESLEDPVFGGMKLELAAVTPALDAATRDSVVVDTDNSRNARVTFTSALAGTAGEYTLNFAHDDNTATNAVRPLVATSGNKSIHVIEGESVNIAEYLVVDSGDYGRILRLDDLSFTGGATDYVTFVDAITGESFKLTTGADDAGDLNIDGQTYYISNLTATDLTHVNVTWGDGASAGSPGTTTLFPRIKLASGQWMAILTQANVTNNTAYILPGKETKESSTTINWVNGTGTTGAATVGNTNYTVSDIGITTGSANLAGLDTNNDGTVDCNFSSAAGPAILLLEEHKTGETNGDSICIPLDTTGGTATDEISVGTPVFTDVSASLSSWQSDSYVSSAVDKYGSYVEFDTTDNDKATVKYPDSEMYVDILFATVTAEVTTTTATSDVVELGSVAVMDSEIDTVSSKNLIVVGGSCINTVAAKLLGSDTPICGPDFTEKTGISAGQFLIEVFDSPYATGKVAMLVAGHGGADTRKAATYLTANNPSTVVGTALKKVTATYEDVVTTTTNSTA